MAAPIELKQEAFMDYIAAADKPVLVDFWATWCGPCRMMAPVLEQIADEREDSLIVAKVNVDEAPGIAAQFFISAIPTLVLFKDGQPVGSITGAQPKEAVLQAVDTMLG